MTPAELAHLAETRPPHPSQIERLMHLARQTARRWPFTMSEAIDGDDLASEAMIEGWKSLLAYDPARGCGLDSWIVTGCRRGVLESLRRSDPLSRDERRQLRAAEIAYAESTMKGGTRLPEPSPPREFTSLEVLETAHRESQSDEDGHLPPELLDYLAFRDSAIETLPERLDGDRTVSLALAAIETLADPLPAVVRLWMEGETFRSIGAAIGVCESTAQNYQRRALARIREMLTEAGIDGIPPPASRGKPAPRKPTCRRGHPNTPENRDRWGTCVPCRRMRYRKKDAAP